MGENTNWSRTISYCKCPVLKVWRERKAAGIEMFIIGYTNVNQTQTLDYKLFKPEKIIEYRYVPDFFAL